MDLERSYLSDAIRETFGGLHAVSVHNNYDTMPSVSGAYGLIFTLPRPVSCRVGALGQCDLPAGFYGYGGSAYGPGGIRARVRRHFDPTATRRWHLDYVKADMQIRAAWAFERGCECEVVDAMLAITGASSPIRGFGASDCRRCCSHLVLLEAS